MFKWEDGSHIHRSWWSEDKPNMVLKKLVDTHWLEKWKSIYNSFNQALFDIAEDPTPFRNPLSCLVLYRNDNKKNYLNTGSAASNKEVHGKA